LSFITGNWSQNKRDNEVMGMEETDTGIAGQMTRSSSADIMSTSDNAKNRYRLIPALLLIITSYKLTKLVC